MAVINDVPTSIRDTILKMKFVFSVFCRILNIKNTDSTKNIHSIAKRYLCGCNHMNGVIRSRTGPKRKVSTRKTDTISPALIIFFTNRNSINHSNPEMARRTRAGRIVSVTDVSAML